MKRVKKIAISIVAIATLSLSVAFTTDKGKEQSVETISPQAIKDPGGGGF